jgi:hypothetical protein
MILLPGKGEFPANAGTPRITAKGDACMKNFDAEPHRVRELNGSSAKTKVTATNGESYTLKFLEWHQIPMVDEALSSLGEYGEIRLIVEKGRLRFLVTQKSYDALKWQPGTPIE